jgi:hypothetical protein
MTGSGGRVILVMGDVSFTSLPAQTRASRPTMAADAAGRSGGSHGWALSGGQGICCVFLFVLGTSDVSCATWTRPPRRHPGHLQASRDVDFEARSFVCQTGPIPEAKFARVAFVRAAFQVVRDLGDKNISVCNHRAC